MGIKLTKTMNNKFLAYEKAKRNLRKQNLTPQQYEEAIKKLTKNLKL